MLKCSRDELDVVLKLSKSNKTENSKKRCFFNLCDSAAKDENSDGSHWGMLLEEKWGLVD